MGYPVIYPRCGHDFICRAHVGKNALRIMNPAAWETVACVAACF